jgi:hemerythrin
MNDTHFEAMTLINALSTSVTSGEAEAIDAAFSELIDHTREHYQKEEAMMLEKKFPPYPAHKEDHDNSLKEMEREAEHFTQSRDVEALWAYVNNELIPWFLRHTETMDAVTSIFLENSEAHLPYWERLVPRNKQPE